MSVEDFNAILTQAQLLGQKSEPNWTMMSELLDLYRPVLTGEHQEKVHVGIGCMARGHFVEDG